MTILSRDKLRVMETLKQTDSKEKAVHDSRDTIQNLNTIQSNNFVQKLGNIVQVNEQYRAKPTRKGKTIKTNY